MAVKWYALRSKSRREDALWRRAQEQGFETFYPRLRVQPVNPRAKKIKPYFPGYLFVRADISQVGLSTFRYMPYAIGLVCFGGEPAPVPDALVLALRKRVREIHNAGGELFDGLKPGDPVRIIGGPFAGYEAIFNARLDGNERVRVLLELLSGQGVTLELQSGQIERTA